MGSAGVPLVPGYHGDEQDIDFMRSEAEKIGYPILIKPTHGGGGRYVFFSVEKITNISNVLRDLEFDIIFKCI